MKRSIVRAMLATVMFTPFIPFMGHSCVTVVGRGEAVIPIAEEEAIIVWDANRKVEHFIRRATFDAEKPFGFLVPTPHRPELAEADDRMFARLADKVREGLFPPKLLRGTKGITQSMRVLEQRVVAGLNATVLEADDAKALRTWLEKEGFSARPAFDDWAKPYINGKWIFTAFRYDPGSIPGKMTSRAIRMSFPTEKPFFPYREPTDAQPHQGRTLRVYLISPERMQTDIPIEFASPVSGVAELLDASLSSAVPQSAWLHSFLDRSDRRAGGNDLYFSRTVSQAKFLGSD
jgi:hypothetical protein